MPVPLPIEGRRVRVAVVGLGQIAELCLPPYAARDDVDVVALCDRDAARLDRWCAVFAGARATTRLEDVLDARTSREVLVSLLTALESSRGGVPLDVDASH